MKLQEARNNQNLTQEDVASGINVSVRHYQRLEAGTVTPPVTTALRICKLLNVDPFCIEEWNTNQ